MNIQKIKMAIMLFMASLSITLVGIACQPVENSTGNSNGIEQSSSFSESNKNTESESSSSTQSNCSSQEESSNVSNQTENSSTTEGIFSTDSSEEGNSSNEDSSQLEENSSSESSEFFESSSDEKDSSGEYSSSQTTIPHHHVYVLEIEREPTCEEEGLRYYACECGTDYTEIITKLPHSIVIDEGCAPTCVKTGLTEGSHCSMCNVVCVAQEIIPMNEHSYLYGYCRVCDLVGLEFTINQTGKYAICSKITGSVARRVVIPDEYCGYPVVEVAPSLFENHFELYAVEIGKNVRKIGEGAFHQCVHLVEVYDRSDAKVSQNPLFNGSLLAYVEDDDLSMAEDVYESKIEIIDECVIFHDDEEHIMIDYQGIKKKVVIPEGVTAIDSYVFTGKSTVREVIFPSTLNRIGIRAFLDAHYIESITFLSQEGWEGRKEDTYQWIPIPYGHLKEGILNRNALIEKTLYLNYDWRRIEGE